VYHYFIAVPSSREFLRPSVIRTVNGLVSLWITLPRNSWRSVIRHPCLMSLPKLEVVLSYLTNSIYEGHRVLQCDYFEFRFGYLSCLSVSVLANIKTDKVVVWYCRIQMFRRTMLLPSSGRTLVSYHNTGRRKPEGPRLESSQL
jgi:hypothetical protein